MNTGSFEEWQIVFLLCMCSRVYLLLTLYLKLIMIVTIYINRHEF